MKNFFIRLASVCFLAPIFIFCLYKGFFYFYLLLFLILVLGCYEILTNIKQFLFKFFLIMLLFIFIYSFFIIRSYNYYNLIICLWIIAIVWLSDIGGYFFGKIIGGKKLTKFSPNKTISGFAGSIFLSQFSIMIPYYFIEDFKLKITFFIYQFFLSTICVIGDIFFSYIKRLNQIKDYSKIIPGHGGLLDRIDGMIFVFIFHYIVNMFLLKL